MTSWLVVTWPVFFSGARVQVRWEHARERSARQGAAHLLSPVPVRGIPGRKRANHTPHPRHTDPHPSFHEPGWIWGGCQAGIQPLVANLHCKTSTCILKRHSSKSVTNSAWCECEHAYTLISSVWQLWCGSVESLWWPLVCYGGISHIPECIAGLLLRLITPEELTKNNKIHTVFFFLEQSIHTPTTFTHLECKIIVIQTLCWSLRLIICPAVNGGWMWPHTPSYQASQWTRQELAKETIPQHHTGSI